jgi:hypothetical protein
MTAVFTMGIVALLVLPWSLLVAARKKNDLENAWYGLVVVGMAAALVAFTVQIGVTTAWIALVSPTEDDIHRLDMLLITQVLGGVLLEGCKIEGLRLFQTRLTRGSWVLHGFAVGAGSGIVQSIWLCGSVAITATMADGTIEHRHLWLLLRCGALIAMESALTACAMFLVARGAGRAGTIAAVGSVHGGIRLAAALVATVPALALFGQAVCYGVAGGAAALILWRKVQTEGWPT